MSELKECLHPFDGKWCGTYLLNDDKTYTPCPTLEWAKQCDEMLKNGTKHVADEIVDNKRISTIWMGLDHQYRENAPPLLFETMIFDHANGYRDIYMTRYSTWQEAEAGHAKAVQWVKNGCKDESQ